MLPKIGLCFCHGWGFDPCFWSPLLPAFADYPLKLWNLGYFGSTELPLPDSSADHWIAVGHSLGFRKLIESKSDWAGVVSVQGFYDFLGSDPRIRKIRQRSFLQMTSLWNQNPDRVLHDFYLSCSIPPQNTPSLPPHGINLKSDLLSLEFKGDFSWPLRIPHRILASRNDQVVTPSLMESEWNPEKIEWSENAGLALGFFESDFVAKSIHALIREVRENSDSSCFYQSRPRV